MVESTTRHQHRANLTRYIRLISYSYLDARTVSTIITNLSSSERSLILDADGSSFIYQGRFFNQYFDPAKILRGNESVRELERKMKIYFNIYEYIGLKLNDHSTSTQTSHRNDQLLVQVIRLLPRRFDNKKVYLQMSFDKNFDQNDFVTSMIQHRPAMLF